MICPACRQEMIVVEYRQIELDICPSCRGAWFDAEELELLLDSLHLEVRAQDLFRPLPQKSAEAVRRCPYCRRKMKKALVGPGEGVMIDRCRREHGVWFDGGELDTVIVRLRKSSAAAAGPAEEEAEKASGQVGSFLADVLLAGGDEKGNRGEEP